MLLPIYIGGCWIEEWAHPALLRAKGPMTKHNTQDTGALHPTTGSREALPPLGQHCVVEAWPRLGAGRVTYRNGVGISLVGCLPGNAPLPPRGAAVIRRAGCL